MTYTTRAKIAARHLQECTGEPYQRLLELVRTACGDGDDDRARRARGELFTVALGADREHRAVALLELVWSPERLAGLSPRQRCAALDAADTVLEWAESSVERDDDGYRAFAGAGDGVERADLYEWADAFEAASGPGGCWVSHLVEQARDLDNDEPYTRDSVWLLAGHWWQAFCDVAADRLLAAAGLYRSRWPVLGDPDAEWTWVHAGPGGLEGPDGARVEGTWPPRRTRP